MKSDYSPSCDIFKGLKAPKHLVGRRVNTNCRFGVRAAYQRLSLSKSRQVNKKGETKHSQWSKKRRTLSTSKGFASDTIKTVGLTKYVYENLRPALT